MHWTSRLAVVFALAYVAVDLHFFKSVGLPLWACIIGTFCWLSLAFIFAFGKER